MFKNLRSGQALYILHKDEKMFYEVATVVSVDNLRPKGPAINPYVQQQEMIVDIKAKIGSDNVNLPSVPADLTITDYKPSNGDKMVLASDLTVFNTEINSMLQNSQAILNSVDKHKSIIDACNLMLVQLNPQFAKEKEQEKKIESLESKLADMERIFGGGIEELKQLILEKQLVSTTNKKTT